MFDTHTTRDGKKILICHMENSHLFNTIRMYTKRIQEARATLEQYPCSGASIYEALGVNPLGMSKAEAQREIRDCHGMLPPYVMEATLRGLAIRGLLEDAYGRNSGIPLSVPALPPSVIQESEIAAFLSEYEDVFRDDGRNDEFDPDYDKYERPW